MTIIKQTFAVTLERIVGQQEALLPNEVFRAVDNYLAKHVPPGVRPRITNVAAIDHPAPEETP